MNRKNINKSIAIAKSLFPESYQKKTKYQPFHFAFLWMKNRLISIGQNIVDKPSAKALYFAKRFGSEKQKKYPYMHAEINAIQRAWGKVHIDSSMSLISLRLSVNGNLQMAKPCRDCQSVLSALNIESVWWSTSTGKIATLGD